jgi:hypothetical protein
MNRSIIAYALVSLAATAASVAAPAFADGVPELGQQLLQWVA